MSRKKAQQIQQEVADLLGVDVASPEEVESHSGSMEFAFGGKGSKPLIFNKSRKKTKTAVASIVRLLVMVNKLQEFRDNMYTLLTEKIDSIKEKVEFLLRKEGVSPVKEPESRILYGDATVKFVDRSIRLLQDGKVSIKEKVKEERFQMKADMTFVREFNPTPVLEWARKNKPQLIEKDERKTLDLIRLGQQVKLGNVPSEVALAVSIIEKFASNLIEHDLNETIDENYYRELVKNGEIPKSVIQEASANGTYRTTVRKPLKLAERCEACGEIVRKSFESGTCSRCNLVNE